MVVYLDVLFAVNALMDGATLLAAARLGGVQVRKMRLIFSAALGGGYAVLGAVWACAWSLSAESGTLRGCVRCTG